MMKPQYIVQDGQSLFDVSLELFGHQDGVFSILLDNEGLDHDSLYPGQVLFYTPEVMDKKVLQEVKKKGIVFATATYMNDAPVPPPPPESDVVVIHLYPSTTLSLEAPAEYTVPPAQVLNEELEVIVLLGPDESYIIYKAKIKNTLGVTIYELMPGEIEVVPDMTAKNSLGNTIGTIPFSLNPIPVPDIEVTQADGSSDDVPAGVDVECEFPLLHLVDTAGDPLGDISSYPALGKIVAPDATVNLNGSFYGNVNAGGSINVIVVSSGYAYVDVIQTMPTDTSYATYDYAWCVANGAYTRAKPITPAVYVGLDLTLANANHGYYLKANNIFGHKYRFTGATGGYYDNITASWYTVSGVLSSRATEVANNVLYDHLTGIKYYFFGTNTWANALVNPATSITGETGWHSPSTDDLLSLAINVAGGSSVINNALPYNNVWSSVTSVNSTANAYVVRGLTSAITTSTVIKTNNTGNRLAFKFF